MGVIEEILKNEQDILVKFLEILQGKETKAKVDLNGVKFKLGKSEVKMEGSLSFTFVPMASKK